MKTTERKTTGMRMIAMVALAAVVSGCSMLDAIDSKLVEWGVCDTLDGAGIDTLAVVRIENNGTKGVGVVLENGMVFTANHVVAGSDRVIVKTNGYYHEAWNQVLTARVVYRNASEDQALLVIEDAVEMKHAVELGSARPGMAKVTPMRVVGKSSMGEAVSRAVVRPLEVRGSRSIARSERITYGDSGSPIVQNGKVIGLVRGEGRMINSDVMSNYLSTMAAREKTRTAGHAATGAAIAPECCKTGAAARS